MIAVKQLAQDVGIAHASATDNRRRLGLTPQKTGTTLALCRNRDRFTKSAEIL